MRENGEWIGKSDNQAIPPRVQLRVFGRCNGRCAECTRKCGVGGEPFQIDHTVALINGGQHREANLRLLCTTCHKDKTKADVAEKSRVYQRKKTHAGIRKPRTITRWRKMDGTPVIASRER